MDLGMLHGKLRRKQCPCGEGFGKEMCRRIFSLCLTCMKWRNLQTSYFIVRCFLPSFLGTGCLILSLTSGNTSWVPWKYGNKRQGSNLWDLGGSKCSIWLAMLAPSRGGSLQIPVIKRLSWWLESTQTGASCVKVLPSISLRNVSSMMMSNKYGRGNESTQRWRKTKRSAWWCT